MLLKDYWLNYREQLKGSHFYSVTGRFYCCLFQIERYFVSMYTRPKTVEQIFHNSLMIVNSLLEIGLTMGIKVSAFIAYIL